MSMLMRKLLGVYMMPANDGDEGGAGGGSADDAGAAGAGTGGAADDAGAAGDDKKEMTGAEMEAGMLAEIKGALTPEGGEPGKGGKAGDDKGGKDNKGAAGAAGDDAAKAAADAAAAAAGKGGKDDKGGAAKTHKDFAIPPEEERLLSEKSKQRFQGLITHAKSVEEQNAKLTQQVEQVNAARGELLELFEEHHMAPEELVDYLAIHKLIKTGQYREALAEIDQVANTLRGHLGIKGDGFDPLKDHADLREQVDDGKITEDHALELVRLRNAERLREGQQQSEAQQQQQAEQVRQVQQKALKDIDAWDRQAAETDVDYKQKAAKMAPKIAEVLKTYPPHLWLPTIRLAYEQMTVTPGGGRQTQQGGKGKEDLPLRAGGGGTGARAEPGDMAAAIKQGLGYS